MRNGALDALISNAVRAPSLPTSLSVELWLLVSDSTRKCAETYKGRVAVERGFFCLQRSRGHRISFFIIF